MAERRTQTPYVTETDSVIHVTHRTLLRRGIERLRGREEGGKEEDGATAENFTVTAELVEEEGKREGEKEA